MYETGIGVESDERCLIERDTGRQIRPAVLPVSKGPVCGTGTGCVRENRCMDRSMSRQQGGGDGTELSGPVTEIEQDVPT